MKRRQRRQQDTQGRGTTDAAPSPAAPSRALGSPGSRRWQAVPSAARRVHRFGASVDAGAQAVVHVDDADRTAVLDDEQIGDRPRCSSSPAPRWRAHRGRWCAGSGVITSPARQRRADLVAHVAAQVAVGDDALQPAVVIDDADAAEALGGHDDQRLGHRRLGRRERDRVAGVHDRRYPQQPAARACRPDAARGNRRPKSPCAPAGRRRWRRRAPASPSSRWSAPVPSGRPPGCPAAPGRRRPSSASVLLAAAGDADQRDLEALGIGDEIGQLGRLAGVGEGDHRVVLGRPCRDRRGSLRPDGRSWRACRSRPGSPRSCGRRGRSCPCR